MRDGILQLVKQHFPYRSSRGCSIPIQRAALPGVDEADRENPDEDQRFDEAEHPEIA